MQRNVYIEGEMGELFGHRHSINAPTIRDVFKLIDANHSGLKKYLLDCHDKGVGFAIDVAGNEIEYNEIRKLGYNAKDIIIGGDSAGGNLSLVCTLKLQEDMIEMPSKLFLLSPWTDLSASGESITSNSVNDPYLSYNDFQLTIQSMRKVAETWYAPEQNIKNKFISPLFADYISFPETLIQVSNIEILLSDSVDLAKKMKANQNKVILSIYKNVPHVWQIFGFLPETKQAIKEIGDFVRK